MASFNKKKVELMNLTQTMDDTKSASDSSYAETYMTECNTNIAVALILPEDFNLNGDALPQNQNVNAPEAQMQNSPVQDANLKVRKHKYTDPISWYNLNKCSHAKELMQNAKWVMVSVDGNNVEKWKAPYDDGVSAIFGDDRFLYIYSDNANPFSLNVSYSAFQILVLLLFKGNYSAAINWICINYLPEITPYLRIGIDYFKLIKKKDRFGIVGSELKKWKKDEIRGDHGKDYLWHLPKFDNFCIAPDNFNYRAVVDNCYNLYHLFRHKEQPGECKWSEILMEHVFGEQVALGYRYLQCLYLHPGRMLPILVLVSKERQTGKTTFINWLNMIFGDNMVVINPEDLVSGFNSSYATANVIAIEETLIEKSITVEKLKALATGKFISVNEKFISNYKVPFFGKIIMASNNEDKFARVDEEEIRFFIRKVGTPKFSNHNIEQNLIGEIPAFLSKLSGLPAVDFSVGRVPFTPEELKNDSLTLIKKESKSSLYKDLMEHFTDLFENEACNSESVFANPVDIKNKWFLNNSQIAPPYIRNVIKSEFNMLPCEHMRYNPLGDIGIISKTGTPFEFLRNQFIEHFEHDFNT
jgi:hypothetical protein